VLALVLFMSQETAQSCHGQQPPYNRQTVLKL